MKAQQYDIFISYSSLDKTIVADLVQAFERYGWKVWWDTKVPPGMTWDSYIRDSLESSRCIIPVWSTNSVNSKWVREEVLEAERIEVPIIPIVIDEVEIPFGYRQIQAANMAGWNKGKKKEEFQSLIERVRSVLGENVAEKTSAKGKAGDTRLLNKVMPALIRLGKETRNLKLETIPARFSKRGMLIFSGVFIVVLLSWFLYLSPLLKFQAAKTWGDPSPEKMVINGRAWLAENLNIPLDSMSWCYDDKAANCMKYGRLYTWENARDACSFLGEGWRLPTNEEWSDLAMFAGGYYKWEVQDSVADPGKGFQSLAKGGNTGFNILLGGGRDIHGNFDFLEKLGAYWSGTESDSGYYFTYIFLGADSALYQTVAPKESAAYCRCIKD